MALGAFFIKRKWALVRKLRVKGVEKVRPNQRSWFIWRS
jgi:hypothetical protein